MRIAKISIISLAGLVLSACSTISQHGFLKDESQSYNRERPVEKTVIIPQNLSSKNVQDYYEVPPAGPQSETRQPALTPPGSSLSRLSPTQPVGFSQQDRIRNAESAKIQGHTNPMVNGPKPIGIHFSQAWVKVGHILNAFGYKVVEKDNAMGTYYVIDTSKTGGKAKKDMPIYQVHLTPSGNNTTVSVHPAHLGLQDQLNRALND